MHCVRSRCRRDTDPLGYRRFCARSHSVHTLLPCHPAYDAGWRLLAWPACDHSLRSRSVLLFCSVSLLIVGVVTALNWALDLLLIEVARSRKKEIAAAHLAAIVESSGDA